MFTPVKIVRLWLPGLIFVVGLAMLVISPDIVGVEGFALMLGGGLGVVVSNRIHRMGLQGEKDRDDEMDERRFLEKYGVWRDEASDDVLAQAEHAGDLPRRSHAHAETPASAPAAAEAGDASGRADGEGDATVHTDGAAARTSDAPAHADRAPSAEHPHAAARRPGRLGTRRPPRR